MSIPNTDVIVINPELSRRIERIRGLYQKCKRRSSLFNLSFGSAEMGLKLSVKCSTILAQKILPARTDLNNNNNSSITELDSEEIDENNNTPKQQDPIGETCTPDNTTSELAIIPSSFQKQYKPSQIINTATIVTDCSMCLLLEWDIDMEKLSRPLKAFLESPLSLTPPGWIESSYTGSLLMTMNISEILINLLTSLECEETDFRPEIREISALYERNFRRSA